MTIETQEALPDEQQLMNGLFAFIDREVMPIQQSLGETFTDHRLYWAEDGRISQPIIDARRATRMASARAGYYTAFCPEELGGQGLGARLYFLCWEELCHRYGCPDKQMPFFALAHTSTGPTALWTFASEPLKRKMLPELTAGRVQGTFAMSEPDAGSDAWGMKTRAVRDGDEWVINGSKQWASWGPTADFAITFAVTDPERFAARKGGLTGFFVPTDTPGYRLESVIKIHGEIGGEECILSYNDVRVPDEYRLGPEGDAFRVAMQGSAQLKMTKVGRCLGLSRWALDRAVEYAKVRRTFGKTLSEHQSIQNMLAASAIELYAGRLMALDCATKMDRGLDIRPEAALTDSFMFEAAFRVFDRAIQVHGGMGVTNEMHLIDGWKLTRTARFSEGPTEIQMRTVANLLLSGRMSLTR